jgi:hypothetical protein
MGCNIKRILRFNNAINACIVKILNTDKQDITNDCTYSWSADGVCWSAWTSYDTYLRITKQLESDFYLRVLISSGISDVALNNCITKDYNCNRRLVVMEKKLVVQSKKYKGESSVVSIRMPVELIRHIDKIAEETGRTRNEIILLCLEFATENVVIEKESK